MTSTPSQPLIPSAGTIGRENISLSGRFELHSSLSDLVLQRSDDAQQRRREQLRDRWVAIITAGFELTKIAQYEVMNDLGLKIFLVEDPSNPVAKTLQERGIATHVEVDLRPSSDLISRVVEALDQATSRAVENGEIPNTDGMSTPGRLAGCWTIWDDGVCLASRVQQALGLRGDVPMVIDVCHDKFLARQKLRENGIRGPESVVLRNIEDVKNRAAALRYPIVLKPVNGAASIGVYIFKSHSDLLEGYSGCHRSLEQVYEDDELMGLHFEDSYSVASKTDLLNFVAEEYIGGPEFDVDILFSNGEPVYANMGQDWRYKPGWMCERGMHHPASVSNGDYLRIVDAAVQCAKIMGCTTGVYHVEMKDDPQLGPQMIECNPRMGGGPVYDFHKLAWNVDLIEEAAFTYIGLPCAPILLEESLGVAISLLLFSDESGLLKEDIHSRNAEISECPYTTFFMCPGKKGEMIRGWLGDRYPSHLGRVDFFVQRNDSLFPNAVEWGLSQRNRVIIPFQDGDHRDPNDDALDAEIGAITVNQE